MNTNILQRQLKKRYRLTPPQVLAIFFFVIIMSGALLLMLPQATVQAGSLNFIDALFTSTSAVCVTGLVVVDTGTAFTTLGKVIVIALIQCGGLGIMTFASIVYVFLRRKMSMANMLVMREALNQNSMSYLSKTVLWIIQMTVAIEAAGAFLLSFRFIPMYGVLKGTFFSVFHSISAFCNAGFDINSGQFTSIMEFAGDPLVVLTISALIILGGTGFAVIHEFLLFKKKKRISLQAKVVVATTIALLVIGTLAIYICEMNNPATLGAENMSLGTKWLAAFFQSVTTRTAGFNTIDQGGMTLPSKMISMALMFIGASPASTGGGIKTTTFCIIVLACWSVIKGDDDINFRFRKISVSLALKAFVIFAIGVLVVLISSSLLMLFERGTGLLFEAALFEAFSAFGTVGLTVGITPQLCTASRIVLIVTMYAGRVGPLTLTMALVGAKGKKRLVRRMETNMMIG